ncbi:Circadian clock protein KaiB [Methylococcales bacterium]|nr:Circadian clock protein KaiB [Methylococcales bacterium]
MTASPKFVLTLYVASIDETTRQQIENLRAALSDCFNGDSWVLNLVEVMDKPEQAVNNDIFATPTLVRESPKPVVKVLNGLNMIPQMLSVITRINPN